MKLRTEFICKDQFVAYGFPGQNPDALLHDAAMAHALVMAMDEADPDSDYRLCVELSSIKCKATELMAQWGYLTD